MAGFLKGEIGIEKLIQVSDFSKITHKSTLHLLIYKNLPFTPEGSNKNITRTLITSRIIGKQEQ